MPARIQSQANVLSNLMIYNSQANGKGKLSEIKMEEVPKLSEVK